MKGSRPVTILTILVVFLFDNINTAPTSDKNSTSDSQRSRISVSNIRKVNSETKNEAIKKISTNVRNKINKMISSRTQSTVDGGRSKQISKAQSVTSATPSTKINEKHTQNEDNKTSTTNIMASQPTVESATTQARKFSKSQAKNKGFDTENAKSSETKVNNRKAIQKESTVTKELNTQNSNVEAERRQISEERKSNTRRNVVSTTTTEATVTDTYDSVTSWDGSACSSRFRPHPVDKTKFEAAFTENVFENIYQSCPMSLVWRQEVCRCGWPEPEVSETEPCTCCNQGLKAHPENPTMYQRMVNGQWVDEICSNYDNNQIWDNENCTCIWDPKKPQSHKAPVFKGAILPRMMTKCMNLVNMSLDEGLKDASGRDLSPIFGGNRIRVVDEAGDIGKSIEIRRAPFKLGIFNGNDLQATVYFKFNFKVHDTRVRQRKKMVILSNGCRRRWQRKSINPSLEVSFFPHNETFEVQFSTTGKSVVEYMRGQKDQNGWYQCVLYLQDRILNFKVNGQKIYSTNGMSGGVKSTDCPLTVAGSPTDAKNHFDGYLDELQIVKQCKYENDVV